MSHPVKALRVFSVLLACFIGLLTVPLKADPAQATIVSPSTSMTVDTNQTVAFMASSTDGGLLNYAIDSYSWTFGDGGTSSSASPSHRYTGQGSYTVTLTVYYSYQICKTRDQDNNCLTYQNRTGTAISTRIITVILPVSISSFFASANNVRVGQPVTLTWATANATSLIISGVGTVTGTSVVVYPSATTTYFLTASNATGSVMSSQRVTTYTVSVGISPSSASLLLGEVRAFSASVSPTNQGVSWSTNGGSVNGGTYTATSPGSYTVTATSLEDPSKSASATVTVAAVSIASPAPSNATVSIGTTQQYSASVSGAAYTGVIWSVNGGGTINSSGRFTAVAAGNYTIVATSAADTTKSASTNVTVITGVTGVSITPATTSLNPGGVLKFASTVNGIAGVGQAVTWTASAGTIGADGTFTAPSQPGPVTITATSQVDPTQIGTATANVKGWFLRWKRDIVYLGTREAAEFDASGMHVIQVDHQGSPRVVTGPTGQVESRQKYLPFGELLEQVNYTSNAITPAKGFTNHEQTDSSGLIYMQARFYAPWYGRFLSPDPARDQHFEETQSWNIYSYVRNSPIANVDVTGQWSTPTHELINRQVFSGKDLDLINESSLRVDGGSTTLRHGAQSQKNSYQHGMKSPKQTPEEAQKAAVAYKEKSMASAVQKEADGDHPGAMAELGKVMHLVQDMASPQHEGFQEWRGLMHLGDAMDHHHAEQQSEKDGLNSQSVQKAVEATKEAKAEFDTRVQQERDKRDPEEYNEAKKNIEVKP